MTYVNSLMDGARLAITIGVVVMITNGIWQRLNPNNRTLQQSVNQTLGRVM